MKIRDLKVYPTTTSTPQQIARTNWVFIHLETDEGITGVGECSHWPAASGLLLYRALELMRDALIGEDPSDIDRLWNKLYRRFTYLGARGPVTSAISAIDIALWDIKGKALGVPIYQLLGGKFRDRVLLYTHIRADDPKLAAEHALQLVGEGFTALKTDPFWKEMWPYHTAYQNGIISNEGAAFGESIIAAVREAVGPKVEILIDAHGQYNVPTAIKLARMLAPYKLTWFEEPVPPESYKALRQVREAVDVPICVGERLYTRFDFVPVLEEHLADYIMPDVVWTGGISELRKIASLAEAYYVPVSPHDANGPINILAGAHVCTTIPNFYRLEFSRAALEFYNAIVSPPLDVRDGHLHLSERPGLGVELNLDWIKKHPPVSPGDKGFWPS